MTTPKWVWGAACALTGLLSLHSYAQTHAGRPAWTIQNGKMKVVVMPGGGHIAALTLTRGKNANMNPLWTPPWKGIDPQNWTPKDKRFGDAPGAPLLSGIIGHNICVDFFGGPSAAETKAGIPVHGEAPCVEWKPVRKTANSVTYKTTLPKAQMDVSRTIALAGDSAIWITETVTNKTAFDRPFGWQQHPTFGPPFLKEGETFFDIGGKQSMVFPQEFSKGERLKRGAIFEWPQAPTSDGGETDMRAWPVGNKSSDFTTTQIDPEKDWGWFTVVNVKKGLLCGYVWPRKDYPWCAIWEENKFRDGAPWYGKAVTRGIEFGTTPFAYSRKDAVQQGSLFRTPTYRWISAGAKQTIGYGAFLVNVPTGTTGVKEVTVEGKTIVISLDGSDQTIRLRVAK
jgi:hypothetical protein